MVDVKIVNKNGKFIAEDENGNEIAVPFDSVDTDAVNINTQSVYASYDGEYQKAFEIADYSDIGEAINKAIEERANQNRHYTAIQLPAGQHDVTTQINGGTEGLDNVALVGYGPNVTRLHLADNQDMNVINHDAGTSSDSFARFAGFTVDGNKANNASGIGMKLVNLQDVTIYRVMIENTPGRGVQTSTLWGWKVKGGVFEKAANQANFELTANDAVENGYFEGCRFGNADGVHGYVDQGSVDLTMVGCEFDANDLDGCSLRSSVSDAMLIGCKAGGSSQNTDYEIRGDRVVLAGCMSNGGGVNITSAAADVELDVTFRGGAGVSDAGALTRQNGLGTNAGDPSSTGDWNGNGVEGVVVRDTNNNNTYIYNDGSWSQIASA